MAIYSVATYLVERREVDDRRKSPIIDATPSDVAADVVTHRKDYTLFTRVLLWSSLASAAVFAALLVLIYWEAFW